MRNYVLCIDMTGEEFKVKKKQMSITTEVLAKELSVTETTVFRYMSGDYPIPKTVELALEAIMQKFDNPKINELETINILIDLSKEIEKGNLKVFGEKVKQARRDLGLKQKDVAFETGLSSSYISDIETGKKNDMQLSTIRKIAKMLNLKVKISFV